MLDGLFMASVDSSSLHQTIVFINWPYFNYSLGSVVHMIFNRASAGDKMIISVHDLGIDVEPRMLFLSLMYIFIEHVIKQKVPVLIQQKRIVIREVPTGKYPFKLLNDPNLPVQTHFDDSSFTILHAWLANCESTGRCSLHVFRDSCELFDFGIGVYLIFELSAQIDIWISQHCDIAIEPNYKI